MTITAENGVSKAFIVKAQTFLEEYLGKIETCVAKLTDEQVWWRPNSESNSIGNLLLHLSGNARQWIICGLGNQIDERQRQTEFDARDVMPREELLKTVRTTVTEVMSVIAPAATVTRSMPMMGAVEVVEYFETLMPAKTVATEMS